MPVRALISLLQGWQCSSQELLSGTTQPSVRLEGERHVSIDRLPTHPGTFRRHAKFTPHQGTGPFRFKALKQFAAALRWWGKVSKKLCYWKEWKEWDKMLNLFYTDFLQGRYRRSSMRRTIGHIAPCTISRSSRILGTPPLALITPESLERCLPTSGLATLVAQQAYS